MPSMENCQIEASKLKEGNKIIEALGYMILTPHPEQALETGVSLIKGGLKFSCLQKYST